MTEPTRNVRGAKKISGEIATGIWDAYQLTNGRAPTWRWPMVRDLAERLLGIAGDRYQVELVLDYLLEESEGDLDWVTTAQYVFIRNQFGYPRGSWEYALWAHRTGPGRLRDSIDYWLGTWIDAEDAADARRAKRALDALRETALMEALG